MHAQFGPAAAAYTHSRVHRDPAAEINRLEREFAAKLKVLANRCEDLYLIREARAQQHRSGADYDALVAEEERLRYELTAAERETVDGRALLEAHDRAVAHYPRALAQAILRQAVPAASTQTDTDGNFTLAMPSRPERWAILIAAAPQVDGEDGMVWFVWLDQVPVDSGRYLFTSRNALLQSNPASIL